MCIIIISFNNNDSEFVRRTRQSAIASRGRFTSWRRRSSRWARSSASVHPEIADLLRGLTRAFSNRSIAARCSCERACEQERSGVGCSARARGVCLVGLRGLGLHRVRVWPVRRTAGGGGRGSGREGTGRLAGRCAGGAVRRLRQAFQPRAPQGMRTRTHSCPNHYCTVLSVMYCTSFTESISSRTAHCSLLTVHCSRYPVGFADE